MYVILHTVSMVDACDTLIYAESFSTLFRPPSRARGRRPMQLLAGEAVPGDEPQVM